MKPGQQQAIHLNCDLGEDPLSVERDKKLLALVDAANIACGGHAGDRQSARYWKQLADSQGRQWNLHLSYPDRKNFGRLPMDISWPDLERALNVQRSHLPEGRSVKFHGALYNQAAASCILAKQLLSWCGDNAVTSLLAPPGSVIAKLAPDFKVTVIKEGFADRRYQWREGRLRLTPRQQPDAVIIDTDQVISHINNTLTHRAILTDKGIKPFYCDTWCIHSDSDNAVKIAETIRARWP